MKQHRSGLHSAAACRQEAEHAMVLAMGVAEGYRHGSRVWAGLLHAAAEWSHCTVLAGIAHLTEDEADRLEPAVTRLENQLWRIWPFWRDQPDQEQ